MDKQSNVVHTCFPKCLKCERGVLVPLSDYGKGGASLMYKAWVCTNPNCGFFIRIDNGDLMMGQMEKGEFVKR